jgi:hypothetical protein
MAYGEELADRLRLLLAGRGLTEKRMFGGLAFLLHGHMAVAASSSASRRSRPTRCGPSPASGPS